MNVKKFLTAAAATAAIVGTIGYAYAQTDTTNRNADGTPRDAATQQQPAGSTGTMGTMGTTGNTGTTGTTGNTGTMGTTGNTGTMSNSTGTMSNNQGTMGTERTARADRN